MGLLSLLIALAAERTLTSPVWQFRTFYQHYFALCAKSRFVGGICQQSSVTLLFVLLPAVLVWLFMQLIDDSLLHLVVSTLILIICFGCIKSRHAYRDYLKAGFRGELTECEQHRLALAEDKNLALTSIGEMLIWLNYRYYIAIMLWFVLFGAPGAIFYRLLVTVVEKRGDDGVVLTEQVNGSCAELLKWLDWLPVRLTAFGYMFVGHFSKAFPVWLECLVDVTMHPHRVLIRVAKHAEDFMLDEQDCTAEPCVLVRLAKRNVLFFLAVISVLTITGVVH